MSNFKREGFGNDLVGDIQQSDGLLVVDFLVITSFRYELNITLIYNVP